MAKPRTPNQKKQYSALNQRLKRYMLAVMYIYETCNQEASQLALLAGYTADSDIPFTFDKYPLTKNAIVELQKKFVTGMEAIIYRGTSEEWERSNKIQDLLANDVLKEYHGKHNGDGFISYYQSNSDQLKAFQQRADKGLNLSQKLWKQSEDYKQGLEAAISTSIKKGMSAVVLSKKVSKYLTDYDLLRKDYKAKYGKAVELQDCEYRSLRLARSEINMAYRTAEQTRWAQMDFVIGKKIKISGAHSEKDADICDMLQGDYPKDFKWTGWHPNCYSDDSFVLTNNGWKQFKNVDLSDLILSLNPETQQVEWTIITNKQDYEYDGIMIHFYNKTFDCLVTPEHRMVYYDRKGKNVDYTEAIQYNRTIGSTLRLADYKATELSNDININGKNYSLHNFTILMALWLACGGLSHKHIVRFYYDKKTFASILEVLIQIHFSIIPTSQYLYIYCTELHQYLQPFIGDSKHIPAIIKDSSIEYIELFLSTYSKIKGYSQERKQQRSTEVVYYADTIRLCGNICELIIKAGYFPLVNQTEQKDTNIYSIRQCTSGNIAVFHKELTWYSGHVYDLTLATNHIMYIMRNGKCFWGSNCRCYEVPILNKEEEFWAVNNNKPSINEVQDVPPVMRTWLNDNALRIQLAKVRGTLPYWIKDNGTFKKGEYQLNIAPAPKLLSTLEKAQLRHEARTKEQAEAIQKAWNKRKEQHQAIIENGKTVIVDAMDYPQDINQESWNALREAVQNKDIRQIQILSEKIGNEIEHHS